MPLKNIEYEILKEYDTPIKKRIEKELKVIIINNLKTLSIILR